MFFPAIIMGVSQSHLESFEGRIVNVDVFVLTKIFWNTTTRCITNKVKKTEMNHPYLALAWHP